MKDLKQVMQINALYVHPMLLTQESLISRLLKAVISVKPLQAHIDKGLGQPEELHFICLSCFCLCPSPTPSLLALQGAPCSSSSAQWSSWLEFTVLDCAFLSRTRAFSFLPGFLLCIIILAGPIVLEICLPHVSWSSSAKILS